MKTRTNDHQPSPDWVEQAVRSHLAARAHPADLELPSPEFHARCQAAAWGALDVLKLQQHRWRAASAPGSLREHFETLARLAGVKLDLAFQTLGISPTDTPDADSVRGLATLARRLGLARDEVMLRLRWGFAKLAGAEAMAGWLGTMQPVRARSSRGGNRNTGSLEQVLRRREADYSPARRTKLRAALNVAAEVYEQDTI